MLIDFQVTSKCHLNCDYCFDILKGEKNKNTLELLESLDKLKQAGVEGICITSGEPLLRKDINQIIEHAYNLGLYVYLSTQGKFITKLSKKTMNQINCIGLPIDSIDELENQKLGRGKNQLNIYGNAYNYIKNTNPNINIKVGTVVTRVNADKLLKLKDYLEKNTPEITWRLYQLNPIGNAKINKEKLYLDNDYFVSLTNTIYNNSKFLDISCMKISDAEDGYFFISPQQELLVFRTTEFERLGSMSDLTPAQIREILKNQGNVSEKIDRNRRWIK